MIEKRKYKASIGRIALFIKIAVSLIAIFWFVFSIQWNDYFEKLQQVNWSISF